MIRMLSLAIEKRDMKNSADVIRKSGKMPAVFYGPKEVSTPVVVSMIEFKKVWKEAGESSVIILKDSKGNEHEVLIHDTDVHPLSGEPRHADFYVIEKGKKVKVAIPLVFDGVSPAVKDKGGILVKVRRDIDIEAAPRDLPRDIRVDISKLVEFADVIHVKDLHIPKGVEVKISPDEIVASVYEAKEEVVEAPTTIDMSAIEVEAKGKETKESLDSATSTTPGATPGKGKEGEAKKI
jgi:large subunit ribosomal protein L25